MEKQNKQKSNYFDESSTIIWFRNKEHLLKIIDIEIEIVFFLIGELFRMVETFISKRKKTLIDWPEYCKNGYGSQMHL